MVKLPVGAIVKGTKGSETAFADMLQEIRTHLFTGYLEIRMHIVGGELWGVVVFDRGRLVESYANKSGTHIFGERAYEYLLDLSQEAVTDMLLHEVESSNLMDLLLTGRARPMSIEGMELTRPKPIPGFDTPPAPAAIGGDAPLLPAEGVIKKVILLGDPAVGKTSMVRRFVEDSYDESYLSTIGSTVSRKSVNLVSKGGGPIQLTMMVWDIAGHKVCDTLKQAYYRGAHAAILVCDITRRPSFENLPTWVDNLRQVVEDIPVVFVGNKSDLREFAVVDEADLGDLAKSFDARCFSASARTGENVELIFHEVGQKLSGVE